MNSKVRVSKPYEVVSVIHPDAVDEMVKYAAEAINEAMVIPKSVWDKLGNDKTATRIRDRIHCMPRIREKG